MNKSELASDLLCYVCRDDLDTTALLEASPDEVLQAYLACPCCDSLIIPETAIEPYVFFARDWRHFMDLVQETVRELGGAVDLKELPPDSSHSTMH